jgi:hypothetical protein
MSKIEVDAIEPQSGTNLNVGASGDTVTVPGNIVKSNAVQASDGGNIISQSGTTITLGASGDTVQIATGGTLIGGGISWQSTIVTGATHTASANEGYWIDTTSNACTVTLPASPSVGDQIIFTDFKRTFGTNALTINPNGNNFQGATTPQPEYNTSGQSIDIVYSGSTQGWIPNSDDDVTYETPQVYTADFLVIAGGGGGGDYQVAYGGGGGGAGGYRASFNNETSGGGASSESSISLNKSTVYTITVGGGGAKGTSSGNGVSGQASSIEGTGLTTITSAGGGYGASPNGPGAAGGSGGGGAFNSGGAGTSGQGYAGGAGVAAANDGKGGGGGASAVGTDGTGSTGGNGGAGS